MRKLGYMYSKGKGVTQDAANSRVVRTDRCRLRSARNVQSGCVLCERPSGRERWIWIELSSCTRAKLELVTYVISTPLPRFRQKGAEEIGCQALRATASDHDVYSMCFIGWHYFESNGIDKDAIKDVEVFARAAGDADVLAMCSLGDRCFEGDSVETHLAKGVVGYTRELMTPVTRAKCELFANATSVAVGKRRVRGVVVMILSVMPT
jgi:hypothetical protein